MNLQPFAPRSNPRQHVASIETIGNPGDLYALQRVTVSRSILGASFTTHLWYVARKLELHELTAADHAANAWLFDEGVINLAATHAAMMDGYENSVLFDVVKYNQSPLYTSITQPMSEAKARQELARLMDTRQLNEVYGG
jgi:hypothetical protein